MIKTPDRRQQKQKDAKILTDIRIIRAHDFIKATMEGELNRENMKKLLMEITSASSSLGDYDIILDTRKAQSAMSSSDLWALASELSKLGKAFSRKTAVICPRERFDRVGFSHSAPKTGASWSTYSLRLKTRWNGWWRRGRETSQATNLESVFGWLQTERRCIKYNKHCATIIQYYNPEYRDLSDIGINPLFCSVI